MTTSTAAPWAVEAHGLVKTFGDNRAVDGIDLQIRTGAVYGFLGPNGAGKTTTIRMLATLLRPDAGTATVFGRDVAREPQAVRRLIGVTGQYASVDESLSATENLVLFARLHGLSRRDARATSVALLDEFGLAEAAGRPLQNFSGGMRRRLDLAASLISQPPLIFLDEPTTGLDPRTRLQMWETVRRLVAGGSTVLLTTQYLDEADQLAERIAVIDRGRLVAEGTGAELKASVGTARLQVGLADEGDEAEALRITRHLLGVEPTRTPDGRLSAPVPTADSAGDVLVALRTAGIRLRDVGVQQPSLDEVFLTLTGHAAEPDGASTTPTEEKVA
jgi:ABC-2 type transport system ATP-binding protein